MKFTFFMTFLISVFKAWLWISSGILLRSHFETVLNLIIRKPVPEGLIEAEKYEMTKRNIRVIGSLLIAIGIGLIIMAFTVWYMSFQVPSNNFKINF